MKMYDKPVALEKYLNQELECSCGRTHYVPIKAVAIGPGAIAKLPEYVKQYGYKHPYIICDEITYKVAAQRCEELLEAEGIKPVITAPCVDAQLVVSRLKHKVAQQHHKAH